ncbi:hypothetical protein [Clostridium sp. OS1-26]|uniref:hypothetical protein n=1 Tax=Clostridium sp. OS1-26 TaxID=3070681 RepID=UPI0027E01F07|nr:hypothetical protein [Clostridium sp. OS1-26]WML36186.1 hypothetical protein RCG18_05580 [Clostridium sp. OS1-26]
MYQLKKTIQCKVRVVSFVHVKENQELYLAEIKEFNKIVPLKQSYEGAAALKVFKNTLMN